MTRDQQDQPRQEAAGVGKQVEQLLTRDMVFPPAGPGQFQQIQMPVAAPVNDVVAPVIENLLFQPLARDAVGQEMGHHTAVRVNLLLE